MVAKTGLVFKTKSLLKSIMVKNLIILSMICLGKVGKGIASSSIESCSLVLFSDISFMVTLRLISLSEHLILSPSFETRVRDYSDVIIF